MQIIQINKLQKTNNDLLIRNNPIKLFKIFLMNTILGREVMQTKTTKTLFAISLRVIYV